MPSYIGMSSFRQHLDKIHCYQGKQSENGFRKDKKLTKNFGRKSLEDEDFSRVTDCRKEDIFDQKRKI